LCRVILSELIPSLGREGGREGGGREGGWAGGKEGGREGGRKKAVRHQPQRGRRGKNLPSRGNKYHPVQLDQSEPRCLNKERKPVTLLSFVLWHSPGDDRNSSESSTMPMFGQHPLILIDYELAH
jgi:hypothetical protein